MTIPRLPCPPEVAALIHDHTFHHTAGVLDYAGYFADPPPDSIIVKAGVLWDTRAGGTMRCSHVFMEHPRPEFDLGAMAAFCRGAGEMPDHLEDGVAWINGVAKAAVRFEDWARDHVRYDAIETVFVYELEDGLQGAMDSDMAEAIHHDAWCNHHSFKLATHLSLPLRLILDYGRDYDRCDL